MEKRARGGAWPFYLGLGLILAALPTAYWFFFREGPPPAPASPEAALPAVEDAGIPAPSGPVELRLAEVGGTVEVRRGDGSWEVARPGALLNTSDAVRTGSEEGSYALLIGGEAYQVRMTPGTEVSVDALTESISRVLLASGVATAEVHGKGRHTFEARARGSDAVARTGEGAFAISNNSGTVAVGTRAGEVELLGAGKLVIVRAGQQSVVHPGQAPTPPAPIPSSLLLKVQWPSARHRGSKDRREIRITGQTEPGAVLRVAGETVPVEKDGSFSRKVKLREGTTQVEVTARTVGGKTERDSAEFKLDTRVQADFERPEWR